ncbi:MAG: efflux transporter outer membrane subunit [Phycisphaerales bacterium]|nr:efflux transporter outer membrane subunit [Phycisphaerales bacterium]
MTRLARVWVLVPLGIGGCALYDVQTPEQPAVSMPDAWSTSLEGTESIDRWWTAFDDEALDKLVEEAVRGNQSLRQAWARMAQASAQAGISAAPLLPEVNLRSTQARRSMVHYNRDDTFTVQGTHYDTSVVVGLGLSWEIDIWRRIHNTAQAAVLAAEASRADVESTALALTGQVADVWFTIRAQGELLDVLGEQIRVSEALLESVEYRFANGLTTSLPVLQQRQQLEAVRARVPLVEARLATSLNALATLLGRTPQALDATQVQTTLPQLPPFPDLGTPADLLLRRPDLRSRQRLLASADHAVAAAIAAMLPAIRFTLDADLHYGQWGGPVLANSASIGGSLFQPIFDADRRGLEVVRQEAIVQERLAAFSQTFLTATREVEDAFEQEYWQQELLAEIALQTDIARSQLSEAHLQYTEGVAEYLDVISAIQTLQSLQREDVEARRQLLVYRANLYLALGGRWMESLEQPFVEGERSLHEVGEKESS